MSDLLDQLLTGGQPKPQGDPLDTVLSGVADAQRSVALRTAGAPDEMARANVIGRSAGIPPSIVQSSLPDFEKAQAAQRAQKLASDNPGYGRWALDPRNAGVAQDDHEAIGKAGQALQDWSKNPYSIKAPPKAEASVWGFIKGVYEGFRMGAVGGIEQLKASMPDFGIDNSPAATDYANRQAQNRLETAINRQNAATPEFSSRTVAGLYSGASSLAQMAPGIALSVATRNPAPGLAAAGLLQETQAYAKYRARGAGHGMASVGGLAEGSLEVAGEMLPLGVIVDKFGKGPVTKWIAEYLIKEGLSEQATQHAQDAVDMMIANPNKTWGQYLAERPDVAYQTALATLVAGAAIGGASEGSRAFVERKQSAQSAQQAAGTVDALMAASAASKTRQRDPEAFKALIAEMAGEHQVDNLYLPADAVQAYMQSDGYEGEFDSYRSAIEEGSALSGDVVIPVADAATKLAGTKAWDAIRDDVRVTPGGMSAREAQAFNEHASDIMAELADKMDQSSKAERAAAAPREKLAASLTEKLQNAGFTPHVAKQQAELLAQRAETRATRLGQDIKGNEYDALTVNQVLPEKLAAAQKADNLDFVINAMKRKADVNAAPGKSLLEFVTAKGGVNDAGGDLTSMGAQDWHKGKPFRKKLVNESGRTLDDLAQAAFEAGYFPEKTERPSINDMLDAMGRELGGAPVFANFASEGAAKADTQQAQLVQAADELRALLGEAGIDPNTATAKEIRDAVAKFSDQARGAGFDQTKIDSSVRSDGSIEVSMIHTPEDERGRGQARQALEGLLRMADAEGRTVYLTPEPVGRGGASKAVLTKFYKSLGFKAREKSDFSSRNSMARAPRSFLQSSQVDSPAFKAWSGGAPVVSSQDASTRDFKTGEAIVAEAYHGTARPDRIGDQFRSERATAGPMAYFTSDPTLASSYSTNKTDTSINEEDQNYANWFKVTVGGKTMPLGDAWLSLPAIVRLKIKAMAPRIQMDDETGETIEVGPPTNTRGNGGYDQALREAKGNPLKGLVDAWLTSGSLFDEEHRFMDVLRLAGMPMDQVAFDDPHAQHSAVIPVWIAMQKPLVTNQVPAEIEDALQAVAAVDTVKDGSVYDNWSSIWDKTGWTVREWVDQFNSPTDRQWVWTRIPDGVTKVFVDHGYDGIVDWSGKGGGTEVHPVYIPFSAPQIKSKFNSGTFDPTDPRILHQSFSDGPRGRITFPASGYGQGPSIIDLFQSRDQSTFLHETGHLWLEELRFDALSDGATDQLKADWQTVQDWFASNGHPLEDGIIPTDAHELWARGVERYLMEGKAPSPVLQKLFETFKSWLAQVYRTVAKLKTPITDEVRAVMDRLVATDDEIAQAKEAQHLESAFTTKPATMSDAEWADYQKLVQGGRDEAQSAMLAKVMGAVKRRVTREFNDQKAVVREEVTGEVDQRPEFRALKQLRQTPMDQAVLSDIYGPDALSMLPKQVPPVYKAGGVSPNDVAELSGFASADEMVRTLMGVETARQQLKEGGDLRSVREVTIAQETDARMLERYGDPFTDGSIEEEALAAIHNDKAGEVMAAELRVLARGTRNRPTPYSVAKAWASKTIRDGIVSDVTSRSAQARYRRAASKAGKAFQDAIIAQDADEAFRQKQAQMLNNALLAQSTRVGEDVDAAVKRMSNWAKRRTVKSVDQDYLERAQALLSAVEMRPRSQASIDKQAGFEAWAAEQEALGHDIVVPASFAASLGSTHWSRLSVDQLLGLDAAVSQVIHLGKLKQSLLDGRAARDKEELIREAEGQGDRIGRKPPTDLQNPDWREKMKAGALSFDAALLKMETVIDWLDEGKSDGVFNRIVFAPIAEAEASERSMLHDYYARIRSEFEKVGPENLKRWQEKFTAPELINRETGNPRQFRRSDLVAMALNIGNAGNVQRLIDGYGYNEQAVRDVLNRELTASDWQFVQSVWDIIDTLWPQISQLERRVNGIEPDKVEAIPVQTPHGIFKGGYYPAIYDATKDYQAERNAGKEGDLFSSAYSRSTTRASSTKERAAKVKRPILLDLGVINRHLGEVIHDITHREAVMNADRFLNEPRIKKMIDEALSPEHRKMFRPWLKFVANQWAMERAGNEGLGKFLQKLRANTTVVGMGFRFTTVLNQIAGYSNSFEYVGAKWVSQAIAASAKDLIGTTNFVLARSAEVKARLDTLDRDINATMREMAGSNKVGSTLTAAKRFAFHGIGYMDRIVSIPTWLGAYNKALAAGKDEAQAIYDGDKAVRISQGAGSAKDLAAVQRGTGKYGEALKLMTMFYSYFSAVYQRQRSLGRDAHRAGASDVPALVARAWWLLVVPPILSQVLSGNGPDDDEDWGTWSFKQVLFNMLGPIPGVRDIAQPAWDKMAGNHGFDYQLSPVQRAAQTAVNTLGDFSKIAQGEETKRATRDVLETAGYATGLVPGQVASSAQFLVDIGSGDADPQTLDDWYTGLTKGHIKGVIILDVPTMRD